MVKSTVFTAATVGTPLLLGSGSIAHVQITKSGSADTVITIYDNPAAASGRTVWVGGGTVSGDFDCTDGAGTGSLCTQGAYVVISATTAPNVVITYA